jgi:aryl-alcohol dehydrogenase-like predicted oxidoreductase
MSIQGRPDEAQSLRTIAAALDAGMRLIDTADVYCLDQRDIGHNERVIAKGVKASPHRDEVRIATKGGLLRPEGAWTSDASPAHLKKACEASLKALGVDRIWLYQLHAPDDRVPFAASVGALKELKDAGKIEHVGLSNVTTAQLDEARTIVEIASVQNRCNLDDRRSIEGPNHILSRCEAEGIAFLPYSPVGGGRGRARLTEREDVRRIAAKHGVSAYEILLAWLLSKSPVMFPIPGASRPDSATSSAHAASVTLDADDLTALA